MTLSPRLIYVSALSILVAAGLLLAARGGLDTTTTALPPACASTPTDAVVAALGGASPATSEAFTRDGARFGRWLDADGTVLLEVRCATTSLAEVQAQGEALDRAEADDGDAFVRLDTEPAATVEVTRAGTVIKQVDLDARLSRTWFVAAPLTSAQARALVEATLGEQVVDAP